MVAVAILRLKPLRDDTTYLHLLSFVFARMAMGLVVLPMRISALLTDE